ncbi:hypothetical protein F0D91_13365 [Escherichia coli]|nr:hypothetical protein [Escherichia coli]
MKKTAPDGAVSGMPAIRETGPGKNLQAITVSTVCIVVGLIRRGKRRIRQPAQDYLLNPNHFTQNIDIHRHQRVAN